MAARVAFPCVLNFRVGATCQWWTHWNPFIPDGPDESLQHVQLLYEAVAHALVIEAAGTCIKRISLIFASNLMDISLLLTDDDGSEHSGIVQSPRAGIWTLEEERYTLALIECFVQGYLPDIMLGTSLRCFLAEKLYCSPMRVSKKLATGRLAGVQLPTKLGPIRYENQVIDPVQQIEKLEQLAQAERAYASRLDAFGIKFTDPSAIVEQQTKTQAPYLTRVGLWSRTEQLYAWKLIECFIKGYITLPIGTRLRSFLAERLRCSPMRISKKLATGTIAGVHLPKKLGTMSFAPPKQSQDSMESKVAALAELHRLRQACFGYN